MRFLTLAFLVFLFLIYPPVGGLAQTPNPSAVLQRRAQLEAELQNLEREIENFRALIQGKQAQAQSLERDIAILDAQIDKAKLEIRARTIAIGNLQNAIQGKTKFIGELEEKIRADFRPKQYFYVEEGLPYKTVRKLTVYWFENADAEKFLPDKEFLDVRIIGMKKGRAENSTDLVIEGKTDWRWQMLSVLNEIRQNGFKGKLMVAEK